jgi:hypothetical protein
MSLGVHFALSTVDEQRLLAAAGNDDALLQIIAEIEETGHVDWACQHALAWDALHRCLTDGRLEYEGGTFPLRAAVIGGRQLIEEADYTVSYVTAAEVRQVAQALESVEEDWFRERYASLHDTDYAGPLDEDDYTWAISKTPASSSPGPPNTVGPSSSPLTPNQPSVPTRPAS